MKRTFVLCYLLNVLILRSVQKFSTRNPCRTIRIIAGHHLPDVQFILLSQTERLHQSGPAWLQPIRQTLTMRSVDSDDKKCRLLWIVWVQHQVPACVAYKRSSIPGRYAGIKITYHYAWRRAYWSQFLMLMKPVCIKSHWKFVNLWSVIHYQECISRIETLIKWIWSINFDTEKADIVLTDFGLTDWCWLVTAISVCNWILAVPVSVLSCCFCLLQLSIRLNW